MNNLGMQIWTTIFMWLVLATVQISPLFGLLGSFQANAKSIEAGNGSGMLKEHAYLTNKEKLLQLIDSLPVPALYEDQPELSDNDLAKRQQGWQVAYGKRNWNNQRVPYNLKTETNVGSDLRKRQQGWEIAYGKRQQGWHSAYGK
ncbi:hypothetical protein ScPMuIL_015587 [Solemya velum]